MTELTSYTLDIETIKNKLRINKQDLRLNSLNSIKVLPFNTKSAKMGFDSMSSIESYIIRKILGVSLYEAKDINTLLDEILIKVKSDYKTKLIDVIKSIYISNDEIVKFHPKMFTYGGEETSRVKNIGDYFINVFIDDISITKIEDIIFSSPDSVLEELVLESIPLDFTGNKFISKSEENLIPIIRQMFIQDLSLICKNEKMFTSNIDKLIKYYLFLYVSQTILMLRNGFKGEGDLNKVFYFVEWEKISKSRNGYRQGWNMIQKKSENIFAYVNLIQILNTVKEDRIIGSFNKIHEALQVMDENQYNDFKGNIEFLVYKIREIVNIEVELKPVKCLFGEYFELDLLLQTLKDVRDKGKSGREDAYKNYEKKIKEVAKLEFLKARGQLGLTLNLTQSWIIFFTRLAIGENSKIRLNSLWDEFERRGICFDKYTKQEILSYFEKINVIEKKSDSGDAQYVRVL